MKLLAYVINGQAVGTELPVWQTADLNGNVPFKFSESVDQGYADITSMQNISMFGNLPTNDYIWTKDRIREVSDAKGGWGFLTDVEKYLIIRYYIYRDLNTEKVLFLMSQGMTQAQAQQYLVMAWFKHNQFGFIDSISTRWKFSKFYLLMMCNKQSVELELEREDIAHSLHLMKEYGFVGSEYGDVNTKGIMDYFNSTGYYAGQGSPTQKIGFAESGIECYPGVTKRDVIDKVIDVMINGNYDPSMCDQQLY